ncbi:MAG TPA: hypothetical protein VEH62_03745 [Gemmatimonadales bacterium]|nr:hypothetical protein [Gemmatimonadales bacterium]
MATYELSPLSTGEVIDRGITLYREQFATLFGIAAVCQGPPAVLSLYVALGGGFLLHPLAAGVGALLTYVGYLLGSAATLHAVSEAYLGHEPQLGEALGFAGHKVWPLFVAGLAAGIVIMLASLLLIVPGIIVACGYAVVSQVVVLETLDRSSGALQRSWALTKGFKGKAFVIGLVTLLIVGLPGGVVAAVLRGSPETGSVLSQLIQLVLHPIIPCAFTLLYYDLRVRKEAFDLELLGQQLGSGAATA